jgi:hypothetical protein
MLQREWAWNWHTNKLDVQKQRGGIPIIFGRLTQQLIGLTGLACVIFQHFGDYIVPRMGKFFLQDLNVGFSSTVGCFQSKIWLNCVITRKGLLLWSLV